MRRRRKKSGYSVQTMRLRLIELEEIALESAVNDPTGQWVNIAAGIRKAIRTLDKERRDGP